MSNKEEHEMYELHCKDEFASLRASNKEILSLLQGNGKPGLKADVLWCVTILKGMLWGLGVVAVPVLGYYAMKLVQILN